MLKKILIIGNGVIHKSHHKLYKTADLIVRFNNPISLGDFDDGRTDFLSIGDTGNPALIFLLQIKNKVSNNFYRFYKNSKSIIFSRNSDVHKKHFLSQANFFKKSHLESHLSISEYFIPELIKDKKDAIFVSKRINSYCYKELLKVAKKKFICPSTGFLTIHHFLMSQKYKKYEINLVGFTFKGWKGHPWNAEKRIILDYHKNKKLILHKRFLLF